MENALGIVSFDGVVAFGRLVVAGLDLRTHGILAKRNPVRLDNVLAVAQLHLAFRLFNENVVNGGREHGLKCSDKGLSLLDLIYSNLFGNDLFLKGQSKSRSCRFFDFFHRLNDFMHKRVNAPIVNQLNRTLIESILVSMSGFAMLIIQ
jgi:hypothetical protein